MYPTRRMQSGGFSVYRQGLTEVLHIYNNVERKTSMNPYPAIIRFRRDYPNQMCPQGLKLSNPVNAGRYFSNVSNDSKMQPSPPSQWFNFPSWGRWVIGSAMSLVLSFWNNKRIQKLKRIEVEAGLVVEGVEAVAEMVEKVATATDEMAEAMAEKLPEKSKMKQVALVLEHISEVAAHEAHLTQDFLHKVEKVTQDLDDLEQMIEPLINKKVPNTETKQLQAKEEEANSESPSRH
ncbi:PREDICTED: uncharacterized protein LOC104793566 isoform X1 [Camelina sativa]|uniref:Uncharacterized protein LOC104793566 isoform X1 n=1 Tax=Camelina sativa TaxID=90675 RepID=A0ABM0ZNI6_CAMSA|nr:PREDICTED: uncharacterized protein LOC104793566 isoform X1 [Camelina sativa]